MVSDQSSTPSLNDEINSASITLATGGSGTTSSASLTDASLPPLPYDVSSLSHPRPPTPPGSSIPYHGTNSSGHNSSIDQDDIVIAVMGPTGTGKSSFVNAAAGRTEVVVGNGLKSQTRVVQPIRCLHPDGRRSIVLVDTPGFDDTHLSDIQILRIIANWLNETYRNNIKLSGLLYLHRISDVRMARTPLRNLSVFRDLCGDNNMKKLILVTTMWDEVEDQPVGSEREKELLSGFWKDMIRLGSRTFRFQGTRESAWEIINHLHLEGAGRRSTPLQIQREMVDRGLELHETMAARTLLRSLAQLASEAIKLWKKLRTKSRQKTSVGELPDSRLSRLLPRRSTTLGSSSSEAKWSLVPPTVSSRFASPCSIPLPLSNLAESAFPGCSMNGPQDIVVDTISVLRRAHRIAGEANIPTLADTIWIALCIAQLIQVGGTRHVISQVIANSGWLLGEITLYAVQSELSRDMETALSRFRRDLGNLHEVVTKVSGSGRIACSPLHEADIQTIAECVTWIRGAYHTIELPVDCQAIVQLEDQLTTLQQNTALRERQCGVPRGEAQENGQPPASTCPCQSS